ncbi:MAG: hypothetical protein ACOYID_02855 [Eubacteriales bacterium]|jgi:hypothetical protein|nr:hypothetical protein [Clostridiales bacterium]
MLKILSVQDKGEQERLCALCSTEYLPEALAYAGYDDDDNFACIAQFTIRAGYVELRSLASVSGTPENEDVLLLCGRAALNFAYTIGIRQARCSLPAEKYMPLYRKIGFMPEGDRMTCDLGKLFENHCC